MKLDKIQITNDGFSTISFKIENPNLISKIKDIKIGMVIELENSENAETAFEESTGLSLYKFKGNENFSGKYLVEDYYVEISDFPRDKDYLANTSQKPPLGNTPEEIGYYDFDAYFKDSEIFLNVFSNIRGYMLDPFAGVISVDFVFTIIENNDQSLFINKIKNENVAFQSVQNPFKLPPYILKPGIFRVDGDSITPNYSGPIPDELKDSIFREYNGAIFSTDKSDSFFRLNKYTKNPIIIACNYNLNVSKSKYKLYVNDQNYPVKKRIVTKDKNYLIFIIDLKKKFENNGQFSFSVRIEDDYIYTSSAEYARAIVDFTETYPSTTLEQPVVTSFSTPAHISQFYSGEGEEGFKFKVPASIKPLNYKLSVIGSSRMEDADPGDLGTEAIRAYTLDPYSENPEYATELFSESVLGSLTPEERRAAESISAANSEYSAEELGAFLENSREDSKAIASELLNSKSEDCGELQVSKKSVKEKILSYFEKNKVPMASAPSKYFNSFASLGSEGFSGVIPGGTVVSRIKKIYYENEVVRAFFFPIVLLDTNNISSNSKILSINGQTDFSEIGPMEVESVVLMDAADDINIAVNNITLEASKINQETVSIDMSNQTKLNMQNQSNLVLECNSKISVVRPDDIVADTPDDPKIEEPCEDPKMDPEEPIGNGPCLSFVGSKLCSPSIPSGDIKSFCDFSFALTAEIKFGLNGFEKVLSVVKVVFCIIDVLCSLTNPAKYFRALVRLFECLWELISLLPQVSIPVMYFDLLVHLIDLLKCIFDKIAYYIIALDEIISSLNQVWDNNDLASIYNLENTLAKYLISFETELDVLRPVFDILDIFKKLLGMVFNLPCQINFDESELEYFCVDNTIASAIIAQKIESPDNLLMVAQTYTTEESGDCGNTPPFKNYDEFSDLSDSVKKKIRTDCNDWDISDHRVLMYPDEFSGASIASSESVIDSVDLASYRVKGGSFEGTFKMSATKIIKAPFINEGGNIINGPRANNRVYISFGNDLSVLGAPKDDVEPSGLTGKSAFYRIPLSSAKNISLNDNLDDALALVGKSGDNISVGNSSTKTLYSAFSNSTVSLKGDKSSGMHPDSLKVAFGSEEVSYPNIPSFMIVDEDGDVYAIEENGIRFDDRGFVKGIFARIINENNSVRKKYSKDDQVTVVNQKVLDAQSNFEAISALLANNNIAFSNSRHGRKNAPAGGYAKFIREKESLPNTIQDIESRMVNPEAGAFDYLGGTSEEVETYQNSVKLIEIFQFIDIYFVDLASTVDELITPCETQSQSLENLEVPSADEVLETVEQGEDCLQEIVDYVKNKNEIIRESIRNGEPPTNPYSLEEMYEKYESSQDCLENLLNVICSQSVSYLATSFKIDADLTQNSNNSVSPDSISAEDFPNDVSEEYISGLGPSFTGAIEYASGIGDEIEVDVGTAVKVSIIPRNVYDQQFNFNFSSRIEVVVEEDSTNSVQISEIEYDEEENKSFVYILSEKSGSVTISCKICSKSVKALTYDGVTTEFVDNDCTVINTDSLTSELALGSVKTMKRTLNIIYKDGTVERPLPVSSKFNLDSDTLRPNMNYGE